MVAKLTVLLLGFVVLSFFAMSQNDIVDAKFFPTHHAPRHAHLDSNQTLVVNQSDPLPLPWNTSSPYVPAFSPNMSAFKNRPQGDPQVPCTVSGYGRTSQCGNFYQAAYGYSFMSGSYNARPFKVWVKVSFKGTNPSLTLTQGNWISAGISVTSPTTISGWDLGYEFYAYLDSSGNLGIAWFVIAACEIYVPGNCPNQPPYEILDSNSLVLGAYRGDNVSLLLYWCTSSSCRNLNSQGVMVFNYQDPSISPYYFTVEDF